MANLFKTIALKSFPKHKSLVIERYGEPLKNVILKIQDSGEVLPKELAPNQVIVEHLVSCVNPADINLVQGVYGVKPKLPAIIGGEGITRVKFVGDNVTHLKPGDLTLGISLLGYWQSYSVQDGNDLYKVDNELDATIAAQLRVNPCTAYRMIKDFVNLKPGDTIIQNGANSAVGVYAIQLAKLWGYKTINVIRDSPNKQRVTDELVSYGADVVLTEEEIGNFDIEKLGKPKLFLDCVGGRNASMCARTLDHGGYCVTYGIMSKERFDMSGPAFIFKKQTHTGFWVSLWYKEREKTRKDEIAAMIDDVSGMFKRGELKSKSTTLIDFEDRNVAFAAYSSGSANTKYLFSINK